MQHARSERGLAMVVSIMAIVAIGALVVGVGTAAVLEHRQAQTTEEMRAAFGVAEQGVNAAVSMWNTSDWNALAPLAADSFDGTTQSGSYTGVVQRLNQELFLVDVVGLSGRSGARQRLGMFIRLRPLTFDVQAAVTSRGPTLVGGNSQLNGTDQSPGGWGSCPPLQPPRAGMRVASAGDVTFQGGCAGGSCVTGDPPVLEDPAVDDDVFFSFGDAAWSDVVALANKVLPPGAWQQILPSLDGNSVCDYGDLQNWGEPTNPAHDCAGYFPVVYVNGNLGLGNGRGQGLLLVEGDLDLNGNFEFFGVVVVRGRVRTQGTGNHIHGALMAANVALDDNAVAGNSIVSYSSCAVARAQSGGAVGAQLRSRGWTYLY